MRGGLSTIGTTHVFGTHNSAEEPEEVADEGPLEPKATRSVLLDWFPSWTVSRRTAL